MRVAWRAGMTAIVLGGLLVAPSQGSANADPSLSDVLPAVPLSSTIKGGTTIVDTSFTPGHRLQGSDSGVAILYAWPANEELARLKVGERLPLDPIAKADVPANGDVRLKVKDARSLARYASTGGDVNLLMDGVLGDEEFQRSFSLQKKDLETAAGTRPLAAVSAVAPIGARLDEPSGAAVHPAYAEKSCETQKVKDLGNHWVPVGGLFSSNPIGAADFQYSKGQNSQLGVGFSTTSPTARWSLSGTSSVSTTATVDFPTRVGTGSVLARTLFNFGTFKTTCFAPFVSRTTYAIRATKWVGGTNYLAVTPPTGRYCVPYLPGSSFTKDTDKQVTWAGAVNFYGLGLTARTGWSSTGKLAFHFRSKTVGGRLCGVGGYATSSTAYQIVMK